MVTYRYFLKKLFNSYTSPYYCLYFVLIKWYIVINIWFGLRALTILRNEGDGTLLLENRMGKVSMWGKLLEAYRKELKNIGSLLKARTQKVTS